jgi:hypothetical protein
MIENNFYVYQWVRGDNSPYYIGKGKGRRAWQKHKNHGIPLRDSVIIIAKNLYEHEAFLLEKKLISFYGRKNNLTGILWNFTDGGDGPTGHRHSDETKKKMGEQRKGKLHSLGSIEKMKQSKLGHKHSSEAKEKMRLAKLGTTQSEETKKKKSEKMKGRIRDPIIIEKIRLSNTGKKREIPFSAEHREKLSIALLGKPKTAEHVSNARKSRWKTN